LCLAAWHPENGRQVGAEQPMAQAQLAELPVRRVQFCERGAHQSAKLCVLGNGRQLPRVVHRLGCRIERSRPDRGLQPSATLIAGHGKQPHSQPVGLAQLRDLGCGDNKGVLDSIRRLGRRIEPGEAVGIQPRRVPVEGRGNSGGVACRDRGHDVAVVYECIVMLHPYTVWPCGRRILKPLPSERPWPRPPRRT
jgi:hypothetical protein